MSEDTANEPLEDFDECKDRRFGTAGRKDMYSNDTRQIVHKMIKANSLEEAISLRQSGTDIAWSARRVTLGDF